MDCSYLYQTSELLYADVGANGNPYYSNNYFKFVATTDGYYQIVCQDETKYCGKFRRRYSSPSPVDILVVVTGDVFEWKPEKFSGDYYLIRHRQSQQVLDRRW
ncbi:MAG: hypothetical protein U7126_19780 [Microcoleus sp.]